MADLQDFEELVEKAKAELIERHPELSPDNRGIDPSIIINAQARQLLKANKNAEGWIASHRRDQAKIVRLEAMLKKQMEWTNELVAERDARIGKLETILTRWFNGITRIDSPMFVTDRPDILTVEELQLISDTENVIGGDPE